MIPTRILLVCSLREHSLPQAVISFAHDRDGDEMMPDGLQFDPARRNTRPWVDRALVPRAECFGPDDEGFELLVTPAAVAALSEGTLRSMPNEAFGILLGRRYVDQ